MKKCLSVKEFDKIIFSEKPKYGYKNIEDEKDFNDLITFIYEFNAEENSTDALQFLTIVPNRAVSKYITIKNYVGLIELKSGFQIEILPKISFKSEDEDKTKSVFLNMLRSLKEYEGKLFNTASMNVDKFNLYEIFINMYLNEVTNLLKKGIKSGYINKEEDLNVYKGKLVIKEQIVKNVIHKEKFHVSYDEFSPNRPENKLIKATLLKLKSECTQNENKKIILSLLNNFDGIDTSYNYVSDFNSVNFDRSKEYSNLMKWSKIFLFNKSFTTFSGSSVARAILFPMEKVFESYVARKLRALISFDEKRKNWKVFVQDQKYHLFDKPQKFSLKPDIVIKKDDNTVVVLDTKWKRLNKNETNFGITQTDMYQMYVYSKKYKAPVIWVIYPFSEDVPDMRDSVFVSDKDDDVTIKLFFVDVFNIERSLTNLIHTI